MQERVQDLPDYPTSAETLLAAEAAWVRERRALYAPQRCGNDGEDLVGLALSGGGIRSATFALGVMQALAKHGVMRRVERCGDASAGGFVIGLSPSWVERPCVQGRRFTRRAVVQPRRVVNHQK